MRPGALRAATAKAAARLGKMRTRLTAGEKPNRKRMAALVAVYDAEPAERRPHDVMAPLQAVNRMLERDTCRGELADEPPDAGTPDYRDPGNGAVGPSGWRQ